MRWITVALLALWVAGGLAFEVAAHIDREVSRAEARAAAPRMIAERNLAQAHRFIRACLRGEPEAYMRANSLDSYTPMKPADFEKAWTRCVLAVSAAH